MWIVHEHFSSCSTWLKWKYIRFINKLNLYEQVIPKLKCQVIFGGGLRITCFWVCLFKSWKGIQIAFWAGSPLNCTKYSIAFCPCRCPNIRLILKNLDVSHTFTVVTKSYWFVTFPSRSDVEWCRFVVRLLHDAPYLEVQLHPIAQWYRFCVVHCHFLIILVHCLSVYVFSILVQTNQSGQVPVHMLLWVYLFELV